MTRLGLTEPWVAMRLIGRYRLLVRGDTRKLPGSRNSIAYLFDRLLTGDTAEMSGLHNLGIEVRQLEDNDEIVSVPPPAEPAHD